MTNPNQRFTIKRATKPSPYLDYRDRCVFAVETMCSLRAPAVHQIIELEGMLQDDIIDPLPSPQFKSKLMRKRAEKQS